MPCPVPWSKSGPASHRGFARERIDLRAVRSFREHDGGDGDMAFENAREAVLHFRRRFADDDGARDVGRAVFILRAGIDQKNLVLLERGCLRVTR